MSRSNCWNALSRHGILGERQLKGRLQNWTLKCSLPHRILGVATDRLINHKGKLQNWKLKCSLHHRILGERRIIDQSTTKEMPRSNSWNVLSLHDILGGERQPINQSATKERSRTTNSWNVLSLHRILGDRRLIDQISPRKCPELTVKILSPYMAS